MSAAKRRMMNMNPREKIIQARISLLRLFPFFGTMAMHLKPIQLTEEEAKKHLRMPTMGVDVYGNMPFNEKFVAGLSQEDLLFVIAHETMHLALMHLTRKGSRSIEIWNVATDEAINNLLKNEMRVWKKALCSHQFEERSAEEIYDELLKDITVKNVYGEGGLPCPWDTHFYDDAKKKGKPGKKGKGQTPFQYPGQEKIDVPKMIKDAATFAKGQGKLPAGMARLFKDLLNPRMNWKELLQKYIMSVLPQDWTYTKPSKRAQAAGFYMPSVVKETVDIIVGVDSSGSISDDEYAQFLSEIFAMTRAVQNLRATVLICDAAISQVAEINNSFDPAMDIQGRGYGGTSCKPVFKWIHEEKNENVKLLVYLTDGYIDEPNESIYMSGYPVLWIVTPRGSTDFLQDNIGNQVVIQMEKRSGEDI